jgi:hypothetical protein
LIGYNDGEIPDEAIWADVPTRTQDQQKNIQPKMEEKEPPSK